MMCCFSRKHLLISISFFLLLPIISANEVSEDGCESHVILDLGDDKRLTLCTYEPEQDLVSRIFHEEGKYRVLEFLKTGCSTGLLNCVPGQVFVDCGAAFGYLSLYAAALGMTVHAVEPIPWNTELLVASLARNQVDHGLLLDVAIHETGIGKEDSFVTLSPTVGNMASTQQEESYQAPMAVQFPVQLTTLPTLVPLSEIHLVSINCQGCDLDAVEGLFEAGVVVQNFMLFVHSDSIQGSHMYNSSFDALRLLMTSGYCLSDMYDDGGSVPPRPISNLSQWQSTRRQLPFNRKDPFMESMVLASKSENCREHSPEAGEKGGTCPPRQVRLHFGEQCTSIAPTQRLRKLVVCGGMVRALSASHAVVHVEVCQGDVSGFRRLFADLHNVRAAVVVGGGSSATKEEQSECEEETRVVHLGKEGVSRLVEMGVAEEEAMYLVAGVPYATSWTEWRLPRASAEQAMHAHVIAAVGAHYAVTLSCAPPGHCVPPSTPHSGLAPLDLAKVLQQNWSVLDVALVLEQAAEVLLVDSTVALMADRMDLAHNASMKLYVHPEDDARMYHRMYRRADWEWLFALSAVGRFVFKFAEADDVTILLTPDGYGAVEFQLTSLCNSAEPMQLGVSLWLDGEEVQRVSFGDDGECEVVQAGSDPGWESEVRLFYGGGPVHRRLGATFSGALSAARYMHVRHELAVKAVPAAEKEEREERGVRVLLYVFESSAAHDGGKELEGVLRKRIRGLRGAAEVHVILSAETPPAVSEAVSAAFEEREEQGVSVTVFGPPFESAEWTHKANPQGWKGYFVLMEHDREYAEGFVATMTGAVEAVNRSAVVGQAGCLLHWAALEQWQDLSWSNLLREPHLGHGKSHGVAVDVLEVGSAAFHSSVGRAEFALSVYDLASAQAPLRHWYLAYSAHKRRVPRVLISRVGMSDRSASWSWLGKVEGDPDEEVLALVSDMLPRTTIGVRRLDAEGLESRPGISDWWKSGLKELALASMLLNHPELVARLCGHASSDTAEGVKRQPGSLLEQARTVVLNLPHHHRKREHMAALASSLKLGNISFAQSTLGEELDLAALILNGLVAQTILNRLQSYQAMSEHGYLSYVAQGIDQLRLIQTAAAAGHPLLILEDDLLLSGSPAHVRASLDLALAQLPSTADLVYLEACYENCELLGYSARHPQLARAFAPSCSAAILWTVQGLRKAARLCLPVFDAVDRMYQYLVAAGLLEAYIVIPPPLHQDQFWGSSRDPSVGLSSLHAPLRPVCGGFEAGQLFLEAELRQVGLALPPEHAVPFADLWAGAKHTVEESQNRMGWKRGEAIDGEAGGTGDATEVLFLFMPLSIVAHTATAQDLRAIYSTARKWSEDGTQVVVGAERLGRGTVSGLTLALDRESVCFAEAWEGTCNVEVRLSAVNGTVLETRRRSLVTVGLEQLCASVVRAPASPVDKRECRLEKHSLLRDVHVVFDGYFYKLLGGKMTGINKMWFNIVPFIADAVQQMGGMFTHCQSVWTNENGEQRTHIPGVESIVDCENLTAAVESLQGNHKIVFSSYYRLAASSGEKVCNILPIYDFIPERMGVAEQQHMTFHAKAANIPFANGFLSVSNSTTEDLCELHGIDKHLIATSPNRVSPIFKRVPDWFESDLSDLLEDHARVDAILNSRQRFLLLVGHSRFAGEYKGYGIFWAALAQMPPSFTAQFSVIIFGGPPVEDVPGFNVLALDQMPEDVLPIFYSKAAALVYPSQYEGFGMPPIEAIACGCPVILGSFYQDKMQYVYGNDALYARDVEGMKAALWKVEQGQVPPPERLMARAEAYGGDTRRGWNEAARDYLEYMLTGPFRRVVGSHCPVLLPQECSDCFRLETTSDGVRVGQRCGTR